MLEDSKNRSMRKTLVFRNIIQPQQRESWVQTKQTLANEILNVMPELDKDFNLSSAKFRGNIERKEIAMELLSH